MGKVNTNYKDNQTRIDVSNAITSSTLSRSASLHSISAAGGSMKSPSPAQSTFSSTLSPAACSTPGSRVPLHNVRFSLSSATANFSPYASESSTPSPVDVTPAQPATPTPNNPHYQTVLSLTGLNELICLKYKRRFPP
ncbi:hypothetical protein J6590_014328 [Homalodisca vitripennis]|nr:hypothetical protein J6590_014328 [Homalodisca vitripennis]